MDSAGLITIKEIAEKANTSVGTVDRVIHNRAGVSEKTRETVLAIIREHKFEPNQVASALASRKSYTIAVIIPKTDLRNKYWEAPMHGIRRAENEFYKFGIKVVIYYFDLTNLNSFSEQADNLLISKPNAVLIAANFSNLATSLAKKCSTLDIPFSFIDSSIEDQNSVSFVGQNSNDSGYLAAKLLSFGINKPSTLLVVNIAEDVKNAKHILKREEGFLDYFTKNDNLNQYKIVQVNAKESFQDYLYEELGKAFRENDDIAGIFVTNSKVYRVAKYIYDAKIRDVKLVGYDLIEKNIEYIENNTIDFLIAQRPEEQGYRSIKLLYEYLALNKKQEKVTLYTPIDIITKENIHYYLDFQE